MVYRPYAKQAAHILCYNSQCPNKSTRFEFVERRLLDGLQQWLTDYKESWQDHQQDDVPDTVRAMREAAAQNLVKELQELDKQKDRLHDFLERGTYTEEVFLERSQKLAERINATTAALQETEQLLATDRQRDEARKKVMPMIENVLHLYPNADVTDKNSMLKSILEQATYRKEKCQQGDEFTLTIHPRIPK